MKAFAKRLAATAGSAGNNMIEGNGTDLSGTIGSYTAK